MAFAIIDLGPEKNNLALFLAHKKTDLISKTK